MELQPHPLAEHQRFLATLRAGVLAQTLWLRLATLAGVSAWVLVHGQSPEARYLFVAPILAAVGGVLEVGLARREMLLAALGRLPVAAVDPDLVSAEVPWRRAAVRSAVPWLYVPAAALAAAITIDTLAARPGWTVQTVWTGALGLAVIAAYAVLLGAWWFDRFGEQSSAGRVAPRAAAALGGAFPVAVVAPAVQRTPSLVPPEPSPGPFPVKRTEASTQSFGTPVV